MEKLASNVRSAVAKILPEEPPKDPYFGAVETVESVVEEVQPTSRYFGLFLAMDAAQIKSERILALAEAIVPKGLAYLCAWGPDCERVHDCFDEVIVAANLDSTDDNVVMTTWHAHDSLDEALWYFVNSAFAVKNYRADCRDWITIVIGNHHWEHGTRAALSQIPGASKM